MTDRLSGDKSVSVSAVLPMLRIIKSLQYTPMKDHEGRGYRETVYDYIKERLDWTLHGPCSSSQFFTRQFY